MAKNPRVLALVLAGGAGSRLGPLTQSRAKPAVPFGGVYRLIDFPLSNCMNSGLSDVWVIEQYQAHTLNEHLANGRPWDLDRTHGGLQILPPVTGTSGEGFAEGNADALNRHRDTLRKFSPDLLLVMSSDHVLKMDFRELIDAHEANPAEVTLVTTEVPPHRAGRHGVVVVEDGRVTDFEYKPDEPKSATITAEIFLYDFPRLMATLEDLAHKDLKDFGHELLPTIVERGGARAFALRGYWKDVGTLETYLEAHRDLLQRPPMLDLDDPNWPIVTRAKGRNPAFIGARAQVEDSLISPGAVVDGTVVRSVIGSGVSVAEGATVVDSVVMKQAHIESGARLDHAIVDVGCLVPSGTSVTGTPVEPAVVAEQS